MYDKLIQEKCQAFRAISIINNLKDYGFASIFINHKNWIGHDWTGRHIDIHYKFEKRRQQQNNNKSAV